MKFEGLEKLRIIATGGCGSPIEGLLDLLYSRARGRG